VRDERDNKKNASQLLSSDSSLPFQMFLRGAICKMCSLEKTSNGKQHFPTGRNFTGGLCNLSTRADKCTARHIATTIFLHRATSACSLALLVCPCGHFPLSARQVLCRFLLGDEHLDRFLVTWPCAGSVSSSASFVTPSLLVNASESEFYTS
jgi:hypothetical protein